MSDDRPTLYLIDGHAQFFRAYHAIRSAMSSPVTKEPTNMTFGFVGMLLKVMRDYRPDYLAVVIDASGDRETFRSEIYPEYKANREPPPDDFRPQVERCLAVLGEMDVPVVAVPGVEADDVIATLVRRLEREHPELRIRIVSKDKDLAQLLGDRVELFDVHTDQAVTVETLFSAKGVRPDQVVDMLALMGDTVDNVPGVKGIGPKTAAQLIDRYGALEALLARLDEITGKRRENLEAARELLPLSRRLVALKDDVDVELDLEAARCRPEALPVDELRATFRALGFTRHLEDLRAIAGGDEGSGDDRGGFAESLFDAAPAAAPSPAAAVDATLVTTAHALDELVERVRARGELVLATMSESGSAMRAPICGLAISTAPGAASYVPVRSPGVAHHLDLDAALAGLRPVLEDESIPVIGHDLKRDMILLRRAGADLAGPLFDVMIASYVVDATRSSHALEVLALALLGHECATRADLLGTGRQRKRFDQAPLAEASRYAAERADVAGRLRAALEPALAEAGLAALFAELELPLVPVLAELEFNGIRVDPDELDAQAERLRARADDLRAEIQSGVPAPVNPDSPRQLAAALFNPPDGDPPGLGLRVVKRGKSGPSTDQEVLDRLAADPEIDSPVPALVVEYRQLTKLISTYLVALKEAINPETGRVHACFHQTVAATGRLSASDPNLQNIPIRTDVGRRIRRAFVAEPGHVLITADYSQVELRLLAHLAEDPALVEAFRRGDDIHTAVAAEVHGVAPADVTPAQRSTAKMVNFGIVYGITPYGLARRLGEGVSNEDARRIIADYKARFAGIDAFLARCIEAAERDGYVETIRGRRRLIPQIRARHPQQRALGERMAINTVVQGSAADLIKMAMIDLHRALPGAFPDVRLLLQIHDELVLEAPEPRAAAASEFVVARMESAMTLRVPLVAESAWSTSWIDTK